MYLIRSYPRVLVTNINSLQYLKYELVSCITQKRRENKQKCRFLTDFDATLKVASMVNLPFNKFRPLALNLITLTALPSIFEHNTRFKFNEIEKIYRCHYTHQKIRTNKKIHKTTFFFFENSFKICSEYLCNM